LVVSVATVLPNPDLFVAMFVIRRQRPQATGHMFQRPTLSINHAKDAMGCAFATAATVVENLEELGLLREITGKERNRLYQYDPYVSVFQKMTAADEGESMSAASTTKLTALPCNPLIADILRQF